MFVVGICATVSRYRLTINKIWSRLNHFSIIWSRHYHFNIIWSRLNHFSFPPTFALNMKSSVRLGFRISDLCCSPARNRPPMLPISIRSLIKLSVTSTRSTRNERANIVETRWVNKISLFPIVKCYKKFGGDTVIEVKSESRFLNSKFS